jgi:hypothetical protein
VRGVSNLLHAPGWIYPEKVTSYTLIGTDWLSKDPFLKNPITAILLVQLIG